MNSVGAGRGEDAAQDWLDLAGNKKHARQHSCQALLSFLAKPDMKSLSHMYRHAWHTVSRCGAIKTTYYLRSRQSSGIAKSTVTKAEKKTYTPAEAQACSIEAYKNGEECEACQ